jgi:hypothetical protein
MTATVQIEPDPNRQSSESWRNRLETLLPWSRRWLDQ